MKPFVLVPLVPPTDPPAQFSAQQSEVVVELLRKLRSSGNEAPKDLLALEPDKNTRVLLAKRIQVSAEEARFF